jgi:hypothetical protein
MIPSVWSAIGRKLTGKPRYRRPAPQSSFLQTNITGLRLAIVPLQRDSCVTATGGRYTMEFKTKAALAEWANDQTMAEIAAYYNGCLA